MGHALGLGVVPQNPPAVDEGTAVIQQQGGAGRQPGRQPVPHHPAASGEVEQAVALADIGVELMLLEVLEQDASRAVDDAFRHAGRPRRVHDVERMIEGESRRFEPASCRVGRDEAGIGNGLGRARHQPIRLVLKIGHQHQPADAGQFGHQFGQFRPQVDGLAVVPVAVAGDQRLGLGLAEAVDHALDAEIRRGAGEHRPETGGRQHRHHGFRQVGQIGGHPIPGAHANLSQRRRKPGDLAAQFGP